MITVSQRPDEFSAAYLPVEYIFTSDRSPNTRSDETGTVDLYNATDQLTVGSLTQVTTNNKLTGVKKGSKIKITGSPAAAFDGTHTVTQTFPADLARVEIDLVYPLAPKTRTQSTGFGTITVTFLPSSSGGTAAIFYENFSVVIDVFKDNAFILRQRTQRDGQGNFVFDLQRFMQAQVGSDLAPLGGISTPIAGDDSGVLLHVNYAEEFDVPDSTGEPVNTLQDFTDDSANKELVVNSTVPYVDINLDTIISTNYNLDDFVILGAGNRFLTEMPKTVTIGASEHAQLSIVADASTLTTTQSLRRRVETFSQAGVLISTIDEIIDSEPGTDDVYILPSGTSDLNIASNVDHYDVFIILRTGTPFSVVTKSEKITYQIDRTCHKVERRFEWLNPKGGMDSQTFKGKETRIGNIERFEYKRNLSSPRVIPERNAVTIRNLSTDGFSTDTGLVNRETSEWLAQITESPEVYLILGTERLPVKIFNTTVPKSNSFDRLTSFTLEWAFAFDKIRQRN